MYRFHTHYGHDECIQCVGCGRQLQIGEQYHISAGGVLCRPDFEMGMAFIHMRNSIKNTFNTEKSVHDINGKLKEENVFRGVKKRRTIFTASQRLALMETFKINPKPNLQVRDILAKKMGLNVMVIQYWFQNQRAKLKKFERKHRLIETSQTRSEGKDT